MPEESTSYRLKLLDQYIHALIKRFYLKLPANREVVELSSSELFAVSLMGRKGAVSMTELADECALTLGGMTVAARRLEAKGYVKRARGEGDRRKVYVVLDKKGRRIYQHLLNGEMEVIITMMDSLEPAQQQSFLRALGKAIYSLEHNFFGQVIR